MQLDTKNKKISIVVPCYNEVENVCAIHKAITDVITQTKYRYEIIFIDNASSDGTREKIRLICGQDKNTLAILNAKNFGQFNSPYYAMRESRGDATILMAADFQDPPEMILKFIEAWEEGYKIAIGIKEKSKENPIMYFARSMYYKLIKKLSNVEQISQFTGFGLYDKKFIEVLRNLDDPTPFLRGIVAELGFTRKEIPYTQPKRQAGKTHNNFSSLYDAAMLSITSYTKGGLRAATIIGGIVGIFSIVIALVYLVMKLIWWDRFDAGTVPILLAVLILGSIQIACIGIVGEYVNAINNRVMHRPLVVEEERINWDDDNEEDKS